MKHIFITISQYLAATLLVALCLSAFGCADSASVNPVVELASLTITPGTLQPAFNSTITQYNIDLTSDIATVTVTAQPAVAGDTVTINGQATTSRTISLGQPGSTTSVNIVVSESGSNSRTYTVLINRASLAGNNSLQSLSVSPGTLAPTFDANLLSYTVDVANNVGSVIVTPTLQDPAATVTMTVNGQPAPQPIQLNGAGSVTLISIVVTAQNGTEKTYLVTVSRGISSNANLQSMTIAPGTLNLPFSAGTLSYTVKVASNVDRVVVTPTLPGTPASMTISVDTVNNGQPTAINSGEARTIPLLNPGLITLINILVTAENQVSQKNYVLVVIRAALGDNNLSALTISPGSLSPSFTPNTTDYTVDVATDIATVTVKATLQDTNATMTINGQGTSSDVPSAPINLGTPGSSTDIIIEVIALNAVAPKTYTITVTPVLSGNNSLSNLEVTLVGSSLNLITNFSPNQLPYTVNVASDVPSVTVTATKSDPNATMLIGSETFPAGTEWGEKTFPLNGAGGLPTPLSIDVTAQSGGAPNTYTVNVIRAAPAAPPAPADAPNLTAASDDGSSNTDNITSITTPDFIVSNPAAGEAASLYIDGIRVQDAAFNSTTSTFTLTTPLTDGNHTITSRVTNIATTLESLDSPALTVTITTTPP